MRWVMPQNRPQMNTEVVPSYKEVSPEVAHDFIVWLIKKTSVFQILWDLAGEDFFYTTKSGERALFTSQCFTSKIGTLSISLVPKENHPLGCASIYVGKTVRGAEPFEAPDDLVGGLVETVHRVRSLGVEKIMKALMTT